MAVNALQETRWRINAPIYDVMFQVYMKAKDKEDGKLRSQLHKKEREKQENDIKKMERALAVCADIKDEEVIFFPYQLDYRGRVYCLPTVVHPQADDIGRSLLEFSDGEPLGKRGAHWLKVHLANCYGKDKVSYEERVEWVDANEEMILLSAEDPLNNLEWIQPKGSRENEMAWRFLAACFEWRQYKTKGASFFSHLPIIMDGTCNGLQHLSALRRDETGAKETNLLPNDQPRDIYKTVADDLKGVLEKDRDKGITAAADCLKMEINREMCKKAVMTTPYGITRRGIHKQLLVEEFTEPFVDQRWKNCYYLAGKMIECIGDIVDRGNIMRNWLQKIAIDLARANSGVSWVAPSGFPVIQETWKQKGMRVKAGKYSLVIKEPIDPPKMDSVAQKQKMVANFIHSLDAAHLVLTVNRMYSEGQRAFCVIHDGFGVHCCNVDALHVALREEFIGIYEGNVITRFSLDQAFNPLETGYLPVELPQNLFAPPDVGTFDIQKIRNSDYFFC